jgi:hypothetical protein
MHYCLFSKITRCCQQTSIRSTECNYSESVPTNSVTYFFLACFRKTLSIAGELLVGGMSHEFGNTLDLAHRQRSSVCITFSWSKAYTDVRDCKDCVDRCLSFWPLCRLFFFDLRILITTFHFMQAMVCPFRKDYQYFISVDGDKLYLAEILVNYIYS